jgi:hypothetical protein
MLINTPAKEDAGTRQSRSANRKNRVERNTFMEVLQFVLEGNPAAGGVAPEPNAGYPSNVDR